MQQQHTRIRTRTITATIASVAASTRTTLGAALVLASAAAASPAHAAGPNGTVSDAVDTVRRHGSVARLLWVPEGATARVDGAYLSAGVVIGTRGALRSTLGPVAPALVLDIHQRSNLTLMSTGGRGAMLVWQHRL